MKKIKLLCLLSLVALLLSSCGLGKMVPRYPEVSMTLENPNLENKGGKVEYTVKGTIPPKYMKKKAVMTIEPTLKVGDSLITPPFTTIKLVGEKSKEAGTKVSYKKGGSFTKSGFFDFIPEYENAEIVAISNANIKKKSHQFEERKLGEGISNTSSRINLTPSLSDKEGNGTYFIFASHDYKPEYLTEKASIYFEVNSSVMNWGLKLNKNQAAKDTIKKFVDFMYEGRTIDKVIISGWASPEGEESNNQGLSERRFEQGKKWFNQQFEKYLKDYAKKNKIKYKDLEKPTLVFENNAKGEDWNGFEVAVEKSNIAEKNKILNVVRSQPNNSLREQKIREMTDIYQEIANAILPPLRRAEIALVCNKNDYNEEQIKEYAKTDPSKLSLNERLYAASMIEDLDEKNSIYSAIIAEEALQADWRAYNNLAVLRLNSYYSTNNYSMLEEADNYLAKANAVSPSNGIVLNNMAISAFFAGNKEEAKKNFELSAKATVNPINQNYNLGMFKIIEGDYNSAKQMMNNKNCDYNMALVQVLQKDYAAAKNTLDCIPDQDAKVLYLKAVLSARMDNENEMIANLEKAIQKDATYKNVAQKDAEFIKYRQKSSFINLVK